MKGYYGRLSDYFVAVQKGEKRFENAAQSVARMILGRDNAFTKVSICGKSYYDFRIFREGPKHIIGMHEEITKFVGFVQDAAEGGSSKEMAFVFVGEPGNGKTFFVDFLCQKYRNFLKIPENAKYTFKFVSLSEIGGFGSIREIESQTYEDPMILLMNFFPEKEKNMKLMSEVGFTDKQINDLWMAYRPLGACSDFILSLIREKTNGKVGEMFKFLKIVPVKISETQGIVTGKYTAKDKITSSASDLVGEESIQRVLHITDSNNPFRFDVRKGALARVGGGGIHFSDELFKNKVDLIKVYLNVIQNRSVDIDGFCWPIDAMIVATSNNVELNEFSSKGEEAPIIDRCRFCFMSHNTDYIRQEALTSYSLGSGMKTTLAGSELHEDPCLNKAASIAVVLTRLPEHEKLTSIEQMKLCAGEVAGEKSVKTMAEIIDELGRDHDISKRFGQSGLGQRSLGRAIQILKESTDTNEGKCMFALDIFKALESVVLDYVGDSAKRALYLTRIELARGQYREMIKVQLYNAFMEQPDAIKTDVMNYVNMIIGIDADKLSKDKVWTYTDPQTRETKAIKIDSTFIDSVEERLGLTNKEQRETYRTKIRKIYGQKISTQPEYDFMDNENLVQAVTNVRLKSDIAGSGSLIGALANRTNKENQFTYDRILSVMVNKLGYCKTCAEKTIEYFCTKNDE